MLESTLWFSHLIDVHERCYMCWLFLYNLILWVYQINREFPLSLNYCLGIFYDNLCKKSNTILPPQTIDSKFKLCWDSWVLNLKCTTPCEDLDDPPLMCTILWEILKLALRAIALSNIRYKLSNISMPPKMSSMLAMHKSHRLKACSIINNFQGSHWIH